MQWIPVVVSSALLLGLAGCEAGSTPEVSSSPRESGSAEADRSEQGSTSTSVEQADHAASERGRRGSDGWRMVRHATDRQIEGFTTRAAAPPGTDLELKVSTSARSYEVSAFRIGAYRGGAGRLVWRSADQPGRLQAEPTFAAYRTRTVVAPWSRSLSVDTTGWPEGFYVLRLRTSSGWDTQIPYIVSSRSAEGTVALVAPVTTWQAYNTWGGYSLYASTAADRRAWAVSFDRPYWGVGGMNDFRTAVMPIVQRAEASGVELSYFANVDLHTSPGLLEGARGYVSMGHDEYWTPTMRDRVLDARSSGTNIAFLGANTMYWRVRLQDRPSGAARLMTGYRHDAHLDPAREATPREATSRFRDAPAAMPENDLVGMLYECYPVDAPYRVVTPDWWGFEGTGARRGTTIPGLVGGESDRVYPNARTPRPLQILSHVDFSCRGDTTSSQSVYYTTRSGAGVFTAGTLRWGCALVDRCDRPLGRRTRDFARQVTANLLHGFADGPVGVDEPARDNVDDFDLPLHNGVSPS